MAATEKKGKAKQTPAPEQPEKAIDLKKIKCTFCGKKAIECFRLIAGPKKTFICAECVAICFQLLIQEGCQFTFHPPFKQKPPQIDTIVTEQTNG